MKGHLLIVGSSVGENVGENVGDNVGYCVSVTRKEEEVSKKAIKAAKGI